MVTLSVHGAVLVEKITDMKPNPIVIDHIKGFLDSHSGSVDRKASLKQAFFDFESNAGFDTQEKRQKVYRSLKEHIDKNKLNELPVTEPDGVTGTEPDEATGKGDKPEPKEKPQPSPQKARDSHDALDQMRKLLGVGAEMPKLSETAVMDVVMPHLKDFQDWIDTTGKRIEVLESDPPKRLEVKHNGKVNEVKGKRHKDFEEMVKTITSKDEKGANCPLWLYGKPGAGKTHVAHQIAEALGLPMYEKSISPTDTSSAIVGYRNIANGGFVEGVMYKPFKEGGVVLVDEFCNGDPGVAIATNGITSNARVMFPNGEMVDKHKDFYIAAADNTRGGGSTGGFMRNKVDAATLSRFSFFEVEYDEQLERDIAQNDEWVDYIQRVRVYVSKNCSASVYVTPRISYNGAAQLRNGLDWDRVAQSVLFSNPAMSGELVETIKQNVKRNEN